MTGVQTCALPISIIKQVPAMALGLFGAMSIVHFRTPVKRPREMVYLFISTSIGVCCGLGEYVMTGLGTVVLSGFLLILFRSDAPALQKKSKKKNGAEANAMAVAGPAGAVRRWGIDFVPASLGNGQRMRVLSIIDETSREALALIPDTYFSGSRVVGELDRLIVDHGKPDAIVGDSWPEFGSRSVLEWKESLAIDWRCIERSSNDETRPSIVDFTYLLHDDCIRSRGAANLVEARVILEIWRETYNAQLNAPNGKSPGHACQADVTPRSVGARHEPSRPATAATFEPSFARDANFEHPTLRPSFNSPAGSV